MNRASALLIPLLAAAAGLAAHYGGWATVTVENLPDRLVSGQPYNMTFSVRAHGDELLADLSPRIDLTSGEQRMVARAVKTNRRGFYTATLDVPRAGDWSATIHTGFRDSKLKLMPIAVVPAKAAHRTVALTQPERGQRLFIAKGCVMCHENARAGTAQGYKIGPDLTHTRFATEYLKQFLADPSIKPPTTEMRMPNLELKPAEIDALVAFINAEAGSRTAGK